jgi:fluoride exporter
MLTLTQLIVVALGGAVGSVFRYLLSNGMGIWLGKSFPYGTLTVNLLGSFLMGLMAEALILNRVMLSAEYRVAILVGVFGGLTTFSSFSMDTLMLIEEGAMSRAAVNIAANVLGCLLLIWMGTWVGRGLFTYGQITVNWFEWPFPFALTVVNCIGALVIGIVLALLSHKLALSIEHRVILSSLVVGAFFTLSGMYLLLFLLESDYAFTSHVRVMLTVIMSNVVSCSLSLWLGIWLASRI